MSVAQLKQLSDSVISSADYARYLLAQLGYPAPALASAEHPAHCQAQSGLLALSGALYPGAIASCADGVLQALKAMAPQAYSLAEIQGSALLGERAALMGLQGRGRMSAGGSCRILDAADGRIAINLARDDDWAMLPAWLQSEALATRGPSWESLTDEVAQQACGPLLERGRLMGLAIAPECMPDAGRPWFEIPVTGPKANNRTQPLVLDLSSLWAGPLCGHLLQKLGARVIKLESTTRPDGARNGNTDFYNLLNAGKQSLALDLQSANGRDQLKRLIAQADIVVESSRPRALRQMGIVAEELVAQQPGLTWVSITAYGRTGEAADWIGFGDDVGVAAGLSAVMAAATGDSRFVGDAIADPLTGMHAALAAWHSHQQGGGQLLSLAMRDVTAHCAAFGLPSTTAAVKARFRDWTKMVSPDEVRPPKPRYASGTARSLGADNAALIAEFGLQETL